MSENPSPALTHPPKFIPSSSASAKIPSCNNPPSKPKTPRFPSYLDAPDISPSAKSICQILAQTSPENVESALSETGLSPSPEIILEVLKFSYNYPSSAVKFFRWAGLSEKPTAHAWNLMVDLLGRNQLFDFMWDAIRSMKQEKVISLSTFVSVFGSYCSDGRFNQAVMSYEVMDRYGIKQDIVAVNSLLSAICREDNQMAKAWEFFEKVREKVPPDEDTFAILLEGCEKDGNVVKAKKTFGEMIAHQGWSPQNIAAYNAYLMTLVRGFQAEDAVEFLQVMKRKECLPGLDFFCKALDIVIEQKDSQNAIKLWDIMTGGDLVPDLVMYNGMIGSLCENDKIDDAFKFLDKMVFHGAFPDSLTYNMIFECLIKRKEVRRASKFFVEMVKNECPPSHANCAGAIKMMLEGDDPETAIYIWDFMIENQVKPIDASADALLIGLCNLGRLSELRRFVEDMLDRRIRISNSTMERVKDCFYKQGRSGRDKFDSLLRRGRDS